MSGRLPPLQRDALDRDQRALLDAIEGGPRGLRGTDAALTGPFGVWLHAPGVGAATQALGATVRYAGTLDDATREVAICTVGAHYRARFEFVTHAALAAAAGVSGDALEALRRGETPPLEAPGPALAHRVARSLLETHGLDDALYAEARERFGVRGLVELVTTVGYYGLVSLTLNAFRVPLPPGREDPFPGDP